MTTPIPRVSIGLPVYNGERYLAAAIESLLGQTWTDFELIITDNASTDGTGALVRDFAARDARIRYHREATNIGGIANHNLTVHLARGEYFKWAAHDDLYHPTFVAKCVDHLDANPGTPLAFSRSLFIDEAGNPLQEYAHPLDLGIEDRERRFLAYACASHVMVEDYGLMRTRILKGTPVFGNYVWSDMVLFAELALHGPFHEIPEILFYRREHPERAMRANRTASALSAWNSPRRSGGSACPTWRVLAGLYAVLGRVPLSPGERLRLAYGIARRGYWTGNLLPEAIGALRLALDRRRGAVRP